MGIQDVSLKWTLKCATEADEARGKLFRQMPVFSFRNSGVFTPMYKVRVGPYPE